jgi:YhcH/YjgK/YiaL family protein
MIIDKISNSEQYSKISERIAKGFAWIKENDLSQMESGTYKIDGDDIFAMLQEYDTKDSNDCKLEGHYKYIDIQYIISGTELMGFAPLYDQKPVEINTENDYAFYDGGASFLKVDAGMFTVFFPEDLHMPCIKLEQSAHVKKVVVKVRL